tara:strand:- start:22 stop:270 length:249 start_codon:yes stop_codon:yes gene_type:complete
MLPLLPLGIHHIGLHPHRHILILAVLRILINRYIINRIIILGVDAPQLVALVVAFLEIPLRVGPKQIKLKSCYNLHFYLPLT